jgi:hypothetical protein
MQKRSTSGPPPELLRRVNQQFAKQVREEHERIARFGEIRAPISVVNWNKRFIAVRNRLYWGYWRFFADFLREFGASTFGSEWYNAEFSKPPEECHPLIEWQAKAFEFMKKQKPTPNGTYSAIPNGYLAACMSFDYDLYVVADNNALDDTLLSRLKHRDQFQGARHELFAEATCLRAGFTVQHENERDGTLGRHVEFVATHKATGQQIAVEAKSKHRPGILGWPGNPVVSSFLCKRHFRLRVSG